MNFEQTIQNEKVRNVMTQKSISVTKTTSFKDVVNQLQRENKFCAIVLESKKVIGIFTERDALKKGILVAADAHTPIEKLMTSQPTVVDMDDNIAVAIRLMHDGGYRHLPVVDSELEFCGLISVRDIVYYLSENYPYEIYNLPPNPHQVSEAPEGA